MSLAGVPVRGPGAARDRFGGRGGHLPSRPGGRVDVPSVAPRAVFGFGEGEPSGRTRWRLARCRCVPTTSTKESSSWT
ncbi:hypothetical protein CP969_12215 [Streptomyces viridosporus T7A]|uniref:Uncharacterized protein n=1 Tax=Streptomyces viridosporus T7A TaxID=665577 RepID=A0ABX6AEH7_STRVD|nr:hypothetical protein CP969_12215 [Streptomyces viridosporus T7A]